MSNLSFFLIFVILIASSVCSAQSNSNCTIGGWTADSCIDGEYLFNNINYTVIFNNTILDIPVGWILYFKGAVEIQDTVDLRFNCKAYPAAFGMPPTATTCPQISSDSTFYYGVVDATLQLDLTEAGYTESSEKVYNKVHLTDASLDATNASQTYSGVFFNTTVKLPSFMSSFVCSSYPTSGFKVQVDCQKGESLSKTVMINATANCEGCLSGSVGSFYSNVQSMSDYVTSSTTIRQIGGFEYRIKVYPVFSDQNPYDALTEFVEDCRNYVAENETAQQEYIQSLVIYVNGEVVQSGGKEYPIPSDSESSASTLIQSMILCMVVAVLSLI